MTTLIPKFQQPQTGAVNRAINIKFQETISIEDFGVSTSNTPAQNSTYAQLAINASKAANATLIVNGYYNIDTPLVLIGGNGGADFTTGGISIKGAAGKTGVGFNKTTHTVDANGIDNIFSIQNPSGATYTGNIYLENLHINGDIGGDQVTNLVAYGIYCSGSVEFIDVINCTISAITCISYYNPFIWSVRRTFMLPKNKGIEIVSSGTTGRVEECFVQSPRVCGYDLRGEYSSMSSCACDGALATAYSFQYGGWDVSGIGSESTCDQTVYVYNARVNIKEANVFHPSNDVGVIFFADSGSFLTVDGVRVANFTGNTTAAGYLYKYGTGSVIELKNVYFTDSKLFSHIQAPNSSSVVTLENLGSTYGSVTQRNNLQCIAGKYAGYVDNFYSSPTISSAAIYTGASDTNPNADSVIKFDDGVPVRSIILNTRGSTANLHGWICTATGSTISASSFVAWVI